MTTMTESRPTIDDGGDHAQDRRAIERIIADIETGFNGNDPDLAVEHFVENATATTATGARVTGWASLLDAHRAGLGGPLRDQHAHYRVEDIVFIRPDVALAFKQAWATDATGELLDPDVAMVATYVMVKHDERWWIVSRANTLVAR
jgi:uncharacterized protein (TIGR02246 family)